MPRDMSGSIAKNEKKTLDKHPDLRGSCMIRGEEFWIAGWKKEGPGHEGTSRIWYGLEFTPKEKPKEPKVQQPISDDEVPF